MQAGGETWAPRCWCSMEQVASFIVAVNQLLGEENAIGCNSLEVVHVEFRSLRLVPPSADPSFEHWVGCEATCLQHGPRTALPLLPVSCSCLPVLHSATWCSLAGQPTCILLCEGCHPRMSVWTTTRRFSMPAGYMFRWQPAHPQGRRADGGVQGHWLVARASARKVWIPPRSPGVRGAAPWRHCFWAGQARLPCACISPLHLSTRDLDLSQFESGHARGVCTAAEPVTLAFRKSQRGQPAADGSDPRC